MARPTLALCLALTLLLSACGTSIAPDALPTLSPFAATFVPRQSLWGEVDAFAQSQQANAPALLFEPDGITAAWTGADALESRLIMTTPSRAPQILALKAFFPFQQTIHRVQDRTVMLWLDRTNSDRDLQLLASLNTESATAAFGPNVISSLPVRNVSAVMGDDAVYTVWSGTRQDVTNLYWQAVDFQARPLTTTELRLEADFPALHRAESGAWHLYWLQDETIFAGRIERDSLVDDRPIGRLDLAPSDRIEAVHVAYDEAHAYLFWNIGRANGTYYTVLTHGAHDSDDFTTSTWGIRADERETVGTPFRSGTVFAATQTDDTLQWAVPLQGTYRVLPVAVERDGTLGIAYFSEGALIGYHEIVQTGNLIGAPTLVTDGRGELLLAWSEPTTQRYATLYYTSTRD